MKDVTNGVHDAIADAIWRRKVRVRSWSREPLREAESPRFESVFEVKGRPSARNIR